MMTKSLRCVVGGKEFAYYDGLTDVDKFLDAFEREVLEDYRFQALHWALRVTPVRWWGTHKDNFAEWCN